MQRWLALASLAVVLGLATSWTSAGEKTEKAGPKDNMPPAGFTALFNGKDLTNWQGLVQINKRAKMTKEQYAEAVKKANEKLSHWTAQDGILIYDGKKGGENLQTAKDYGNF